MKGYTFEFDISSVEDYDWYDIVLLPTEIEQLMDLATTSTTRGGRNSCFGKRRKSVKK